MTCARVVVRPGRLLCTSAGNARPTNRSSGKKRKKEKKEKEMKKPRAGRKKGGSTRRRRKLKHQMEQSEHLEDEAMARRIELKAPLSLRE